MDLVAFTGLGAPWLVVVGLIIVLAAIVQLGLGMGFGLTAAPLLALIDPALVPGPTLILGMLSSTWGAIGERQAIAWNEVGIGSIGRAAGVVIATGVLTVLAGGRGFSIAFGLMVGLAVAMSIYGRRIPFTRRNLIGMSTLSGLMATITSVGAPPLALMYQDRPSAEARPTLAAFFALGCLFSLAGLAASGHAGSRDLVLAGLMLPPMLAGIVVARGLRGRFDRRYRPALLTVAGVAAALLVLRGLA
ncbi:sulfite exporter TauE/SafE family protein [Aquibium carbonis]|uniref:Probable membrane transporter protein n=1 Tax=Aquibium carbonis TaxID=2495581 RepID=A0A3S0A670_9HYPH|nr:sulfite exporter TauE/SafE family protein [Aquibium carbonis]RST85695.1 sulfite exporter TauE/SafE family protein [Aquibium carbonis]